MAKYKIAIPEMPIDRSLLPQRVLEMCEIVEGVKGERGGNDVLLSMIDDADGIVFNSSNDITPELMSKGNRLKIVFKSGAHPENVDYEYARENGIAVGWTPAANAQSVAEYTVLMMLASLKKYVYAANTMAQGAWRNQDHIGHDINGLTVGIVGLGGIGQTVACMLKGFGAKIIAYDPFTKDEVFVALNVKRVTFDELLAASDIVTIHCMVTDQTRNMFNREAFAKMKPEAILINSARGAMIDEEALYEALTTNQIRMAALDVYATEPPAMDHPLRSLSNVVLTPHTAARTEEAAYRECAWAIEGCLDYLEGNKVKNATVIYPNNSNE